MSESATVRAALAAVLQEILHGSAPDAGWLLNPRDPGLLRSLETLSAAQASAVPAGSTSSIAAHVDHLRYGLALLNRWADGEEPFEGADWAASWLRTAVSEPEWRTLLDGLRAEAERWQTGFGQLLGRGEPGLTGAIACAAHLAYHLGAIRQLDRAARGPTATDSPS